MFIEFFKRFLPGVKSFHDMVQDRKNYIDALRKWTPSLLRKSLNHVTDRKFMKELIRRLYCYNDHSVRYRFGFTDNRAYGGGLKTIYESCTLEAIKKYKPESSSISTKIYNLPITTMKQR